MTHVIATRPGVGGTAGVVQQQVLRFARVPISQPILMVVRHGRKIVRGPGIELTIEQGEAVAIAQDQVFDIENHVSPEGHYEAHWLTWDQTLLRSFERQKPLARVVDGAHTLGKLPPAFQRAIDAAIEAIREPASVPDRIAAHRLGEVLAWIEEHGGRFEIREPTTTTARVRRCILASPDAGWTSAAVAAELGMSEATLRRRLAAEGVSLGELMADIRMSFAMQLLQSTTLPISRIALDVGYESASRFAMRFRRRFGFAPSALRGHQRDGAPVELIDP